MQRKTNKTTTNEPILTHVVYGLIYVGSVFILPLLILLWASQSNAAPFLNLLSSSTLLVSLFLGLFIYRRTIKQKLKELEGQWLRVLGMVGLAFVVRIVLSTLSVMIFGEQSSVNQEAIEQLMDQIPLGLYFVLIVIAAPVSEELFFREVILHGANTTVKKWLLGAFSVILFSFVHVIADPPAIVLFVPLALPIVWIYLYFNNNVVVSMITHMFFNLIAFFAILVQTMHPEFFQELQNQVEGMMTHWLF